MLYESIGEFCCYFALSIKVNDYMYVFGRPYTFAGFLVSNNEIVR